ncbi:Na+/H+ antiporter NhaA [Veillonella criceti]|uniref:Na(+)/H(+) antiporter NhaA n=1 Tax=Veillonella criceti TaxID=103891 RepID=A0A380NGE3_9FIRM|nr:Na+/H+ antiporter NhaA [Veillonella criceti]SUP40071.1 Sodium/proton antiporter nhaA [Veillonella criceti]
MSRIKAFLQSPSAGGILLLVSAALAIGVANSAYSDQYFHFLKFPLGPFAVEAWVNDVLMAIFFLGVGLEIKHEMINGELNTNAKRILPTVAAFCGVMVPAVIYFIFNHGNPMYHRGWAIPTATDIAFSIGVVSLLGTRVPVAMKVLLTTLAVVDDLIAVVIIAAFYTESLQFLYMGMAVLIFILLMILNKRNIFHPLPYVVLGVVLWYCIFKSGLHATLSGVFLAMTIPYRAQYSSGKWISPVMQWNSALIKWITFLILPLFGFINAGVSFSDFSFNDLFHPVVLGVSLALFIGKQVGVFSTVYILVKTKLVDMPVHATWSHVYGIAVCCGIGFTMSLFVDLLAFPPSHAQEMAKVGIFIGSIFSGVIGYVVLRYFTPDVSELERKDD